jgi:ABC-type Fe3+-hydroxamate transport system substrate-binding protein
VNAEMVELVDSLGHTLQWEGPAQRLVSCVPSVSELVYDLGAVHRLVGCTKYCIYPPQLMDQCTLVGGTKNLNLSTIRNLKPDLIIGVKEENRKGPLEALQAEFPVYVADVVTLKDALGLIADVGTLLGLEEQAGQMVKSILRDMEVPLGPPPAQRKKVLYLIWKNPWMAAGGDTFIHHCLDWGGWQNLMHNHFRYPTVSMEEMKKWDPEEIFLSSEPYPFGEEDKKLLEKEFPKAKIRLVDGSLFSWYGSRMLMMKEYFASLQEG